MITEVAQLQIDPSEAQDFEAAVAECIPFFRSAKGCHGFVLERQIEDPGRYYLRVQWESVSDHMEDFRRSPAFQDWRATAGPFFIEPPVVHHAEQTTVRFD